MITICKACHDNEYLRGRPKPHTTDSEDTEVTRSKYEIHTSARFAL